MQLFIRVNSSDSFKICESLSGIDQINFKRLNQKERTICLVALENYICRGKTHSTSRFLSSHSIEKINQKLRQEKPQNLSQRKKITHRILSLVKGALNLVGLRVSSSQLNQLNAQYQKMKIKNLEHRNTCEALLYQRKELRRQREELQLQVEHWREQQIHLKKLVAGEAESSKIPQ